MSRTPIEVVVGEQPDWWQWAACLGTDPDLFFPPVGDNRREVNSARAVCATCAARSLCLEFAIDNRIRHGIWGGKTEQERRKIIRQRKVAAAA